MLVFTMIVLYRKGSEMGSHDGDEMVSCAKMRKLFIQFTVLYLSVTLGGPIVTLWLVGSFISCSNILIYEIQSLVGPLYILFEI